ncbi:TRAP transporter small permease [Roseomonas sp. GCM10028921]
MSEPARQSGTVARLATGLAYAGGIVMLLAALLCVASILRRWLLGQPITGDFELLALGTGIGVFGFLAYGTLMRSNIMVDTFTTALPRRWQEGVDAFWSLVWAAVALVLAERMTLGAYDTFASGTTTMMVGLPTWWAVGIGALCLLITGFAALRGAWRLAAGKEG